MAQSPLMVRASLSKTPSHWNPATDWLNPLVGLDPRPVKVHHWHPQPGNTTLKGVECKVWPRASFVRKCLIWICNKNESFQSETWPECQTSVCDSGKKPWEKIPLVIFCCTAPTSGKSWTICNQCKKKNTNICIFFLLNRIVYFFKLWCEQEPTLFYFLLLR